MRATPADEVREFITDVGAIEHVSTLVFGLVSGPDLLRLLAVPVFAWAAYRDIKTRRVPNRTWLPLALVGVVALGWDTLIVSGMGGFEQRLFVIRVVLSLGLVAPLGYVFWRLGGFGGADAKAIMTLALVYPVYPIFYLASGAYPAHQPPLGVFSLSILSNTVLVGLAYPLVLAARNGVRGSFVPAMFIGRPVTVDRVTDEYGRLLETPNGFTRRGLDIDALRMYLRWRGVSFEELRADPNRYRHPLPTARHDPGDGSIVTDGGLAPAIRPLDTWGTARFLDEHDAYGTTPQQLREGLETLVECDRETVWITPGIPFIVPMFLGLLVALTYGDLLFALLAALGAA